MGKGEIACYEQFLLFPQCFQKACFPGASKVSLFGNGLKRRGEKAFENIVGKGENAAYQQLHLFHSVFPEGPKNPLTSKNWVRASELSFFVLL